LLKVGFGIRKDAKIEEIEIDISTLENEEEDVEVEVPDVEGQVEEEDYRGGEDKHDNEERGKHHNDEL